MIAWWLLLACRPAGPWTADAALAPTLARLDRDHDGRVVAAEFDAVAFPGVPFARVDTDGDGALSVEELASCVLGQEPADFFVMAPGRRHPGGEPGEATRIHETAAWQTLESLRQELVAVNPSASTPSAAELERVALGGLRSPDGEAMLREFAAAYAREGLTFPLAVPPPSRGPPGPPVLP